MTLKELEAKWRKEAADARAAVPEAEAKGMLISATANSHADIELRACADELASTLRSMTCATCKHGRGMSQPEAMNDEPRCCHPSEAHPLHWQETSPSFGCIEWAASPPLEEK